LFIFKEFIFIQIDQHAPSAQVLTGLLNRGVFLRILQR